VDVGDQLAEVVRVEGARVLATLVRWLGDWSLAEEAVQEASIAALRDWAAHGVPDEPRAWLTTTARRKAIDVIRRERARRGKEQAATALVALSRATGREDTVVDDDLLRLIFTCCHPSLAPEARLALALRTLCQLSVAQVAAAMLTTETAMARRLTRTKHKIATAHIPYRVPSDAELPERLGAVCGVVHALYTAGHAPLGGQDLVDLDLCREGLRLARLLVGLLPDEPAPAAVLALLLLTEARRPARLAADGTLVVLAEQDRSRWAADLIEEGGRLLATSLRRTGGVADPYQLQAAVAWEHDRAPSYDATDWVEVRRLYDLLLSVAPSQPAALARAVAVAECDGADAGLRALAGLVPDVRTAGVRAELLARAGRYADAVAALDSAAVDRLTAPERRYREERRAGWALLAGPEW
jgi:RNA polymerase sigma factor (sigma-70 family)